MTRIRWSPLIDTFFSDDWARRWDDELAQWFRSPLALLGEPLATGQWRPALNLREQPDAYAVEVDLPGIDETTLKLNLEGDLLTIDGERPAPAEDRSYLRQELPFGVFHHEIRLPAPVEGDRVEAHYHDGVLTVRLPKRAEVQPRQITVSTNAS